jgi:hypothetical protein
MADDKATTPLEGAPAVEGAPAPAPAPEVTKDETTAAPESKDDEKTKNAAPAEEKPSLEEAAEGKLAIYLHSVSIAFRRHPLTLPFHSSSQG